MTAPIETKGPTHRTFVDSSRNVLGHTLEGTRLMASARIPKHEAREWPFIDFDNIQVNDTIKVRKPGWFSEQGVIFQVAQIDPEDKANGTAKVIHFVCVQFGYLGGWFYKVGDHLDLTKAEATKRKFKFRRKP